MPQICTVCKHPKLQEINSALIQATPNRRIATQYGLSEAARRRHRANHLQEIINELWKKGGDAVKKAGGEGIMSFKSSATDTMSIGIEKYPSVAVLQKAQNAFNNTTYVHCHLIQNEIGFPKPPESPIWTAAVS